jgi:hypothetical protein
VVLDWRWYWGACQSFLTASHIHTSPARNYKETSIFNEMLANASATKSTSIQQQELISTDVALQIRLAG